MAAEEKLGCVHHLSKTVGEHMKYDLIGEVLDKRKSYYLQSP